MAIVLILAASFLQTAEAVPQPAGTSAQVRQPNVTPLSEIDSSRFRSRDDVRSAVKSEMQSPRYKRLRTRIKQFELDLSSEQQQTQTTAPGWWTRFWTWVGSWARPNPRKTTAPSNGSSTTMSFGFGAGGLLWPLVWVLGGIALLVLIALVIKAAAVKRSGGNVRKVRVDSDSDAIAPSTPPGELPSDEYMHRALELAKDGDHRRALRQLVLGGMSWIERAGLIRFRKGLTNRDYVRAVYRRTEQRKRLSGIILDFERVYFGRREATPEQFEECLNQYRDAFGKPADPAKIAQETQAAAAATRTEPRKPSQQTELSQPETNLANNAVDADQQGQNDFDFLDMGDES